MCREPREALELLEGGLGGPLGGRGGPLLPGGRAAETPGEGRRPLGQARPSWMGGGLRGPSRDSSITWVRRDSL